MDDKIETPIPTRAVFNQRVMDFKKQYKGKLKDLLDKEKNPEASAIFWQDPVVRAYLGRVSVEYQDNHPDLRDSSNKQAHEPSDHYELKVYEYFPDEIPYRSDTINRRPFNYFGGTKVTGKGLLPFFDNLNTNKKDIEILKSQDIYEISQDVLTRFVKEGNNSSARFILAPSWKDTHATTCLTILDPETREPLSTVFLNSSQSEKYYASMRCRFLMPMNTHVAPLFHSTLKTALNKQFKIKLEDEHPTERRIMVDEEYQTALVLKSKRTLDDPELDTVHHNPNINKIYHFVPNKETGELELALATLQHQAPFIDASHNIQLRVTDKNCTLYGVSFIQGIINFLNEPERANRVYELARGSKSGNKADETKLADVFQEELKAYLPCYYEANGNVKSNEEIDQYNAKLRWKVGVQSIPTKAPNITHSLKKTFREEEIKYKNLLDEIISFNLYCSELKDPAAEKKQIILNKLINDFSKKVGQFFYKIDARSETDLAISFEMFKREYEQLVLTADKCFNAPSKTDDTKSNNTWYDILKPILKGFMGVVTAIAATLCTAGILPYLVVTHEKYNAYYKETFFRSDANAPSDISSPSDTESDIQLERETMIEKFNHIKKKLLDEKGLVGDIEEKIKNKTSPKTGSSN